MTVKCVVQLQRKGKYLHAYICNDLWSDLRHVEAVFNARPADHHLPWCTQSTLRTKKNANAALNKLD